MTAEWSEVSGSPAGIVPVDLEKEALDVLNEILAKVNPREKLIGIGAIVFLVGWLVGLLLASVSYNYGVGSVSANVFNESGGTGLGFLGVVAAVAALAVLYLKYAPNMQGKVTWPQPIPVILLVISAVAGLVALDLLWNNFSNSQDWGKATGLGVTGFPSWPITDWIAVLGVVVGAGIMCYAAYMEWNTNKSAA
jgi:hypothetical protein